TRDRRERRPMSSPDLRDMSRRARLSRSADAPPPIDRRSTTRARLGALELRDRARPAAGARDLARGPRDGATEALDRRDWHARGEAGEADRGLGPAIGAEDRATDAHDPLGRLLLIDGIASPPDRGELALEARERRDGVLRARRELVGRFVEPVDLVVRKEREHRLA